MSLRVALLHSSDATLAHGEPHDALAVAAVREEIDGVAAACRANGFEPVAVEASDPKRTLDALGAARPDVVFNLAESVGGEARLEAAVAWLLEWARLPYTGSGPIALTLALSKPLARAVLAAHGVGIPEGFVMERSDGPIPAEFRRRRSIVKPAREDASHGIALESVVDGETALRRRAAYVIERYAQPALVEEFVEGREFNVAILGAGPRAVVLPLSEIDYSRFPRGAPRLITFEGKWNTESAEYKGSEPVPATGLDPALESRVKEAASKAYHALGLTGYGRVDLRIHPERGPLVLDVNPNPDISPTAGLARAAARGGLDHAQLIARIIAEARDAGARQHGPDAVVVERAPSL